MTAAVDNRFYTYCYLNPTTNKPFYIGKGCGSRMGFHLLEAKNTDTSNHKLNTIRKILAEGKEPIIDIVLSDASESDAFELEEFLIAEIGRSDLGLGPLTNLTDGGEGFSGFCRDMSGDKNPNYGNTGELSCWFGKTHTEETKQKMSDAQKGRIFTDEHKQAMRKPKSEAGRIAIAKAQRAKLDAGWKPSKASNIKRSETLKGRIITDEHAGKISASLKGKPKKKVVCPHCHKEGGNGLMQRWHFDNCKLKDFK